MVISWLCMPFCDLEFNMLCFLFMLCLYVVFCAANKRLKRDCQRVAFPVPMSRGGYGCCV
ncbi:hypothetical protein FXE81_10295 [Vibrio cholerae]|nr:hypothetical protein [Vibrio cholerae]TXX61460.1 hypothetical protein FXF04_11090 [Vibrio cholerae]TXY67555.1 hypothetical protein FXE81_10295 [Vibrio cholerae]